MTLSPATLPRMTLEEYLAHEHSQDRTVGGDDAVQVLESMEDALRLESIGLEVPLAEIYG